MTIEFFHDGVGKKGASYITRILYFIEHLYLSCDQIGDAGASFISESVRETVTLKTLILCSCGITSRGAKDLSRALAQNSSLAKFDITLNNLGDEGISHVAEAFKQNTQLRELWIGDCGMTDKGAASLASALKISNSLKMLHMGGLKGALTEDGLSTMIQSLGTNSGFMKLSISIEFGSAVVFRLRQKLNESRKNNGLPPIKIEGIIILL